MMWPFSWFKKRREEKLRKRQEAERKRKELERKRRELEEELMRLYEEDEDFRQFVKLMDMAVKAKDSFSAVGLMVVAAAHLEEVIEKYNWDKEKFSGFLDSAEKARQELINFALRQR